MNRAAERTLHEIAEETSKLRAALARMEERLARASATRQHEATRLSQDIKAISARVVALERRAAH
jgi:hypothetical protein